jgi:hypothetical protein
MLLIASNALRAPRYGVLVTGVDPPNCSGEWPLAEHATLRTSSGAPAPDRGHALLRALLRDARQKGADFRLPVPAVSAERPD